MTPRPDPGTVRVPGPWIHRDVSANGIRLHVAELGSGPLVLLLHGFPEFWWSWRHQLVTLADAGFRAVAVDLRGYGDSDKPPRGYDGWTLAGDIAGLVRALGESRASLVGHDWGGLLAWTVATLQPRLVRSIGVLAAAHPLALRRALLAARSETAYVYGFQLPRLAEHRLTRGGGEGVERLVRRWSGPDWPASPGFAEVVRRLRSAMLIQGAAHSALEYYRWALRSRLRTDGRRFAAAVDHRVRVPVLQLHGALDGRLTVATAAQAARWAGPDYRYRLLEGVGHFVHQEAPERTSALLADFLRDTS